MSLLSWLFGVDSDANQDIKETRQYILKQHEWCQIDDEIRISVKDLEGSRCNLVLDVPRKYRISRVDD